MKNIVVIVFAIVMGLAVSGIAFADSIQGLGVDENGNVGVGTNAPVRQFEVYDDGSVGQAAIGVKSQVNGKSRIFFANTTTETVAGITYHHSEHSVWQDLMCFLVNYADRMVIDRNGNIGIATHNQFGGGAGVLSIANATTAPTSAPAGGALFYVSGGRIYANDSNACGTLISPHPSEEIEALADPKDPYPYFYKSTNTLIGKELVIDMGKAIRLLQTLFPKEQFIWYRDVPRVDSEAAQRELWKEKWIAENKSEVEIPKSEAFESVEVEVEDTSRVASEKITYRLEGEEVIEERVPVYAKRVETQRRLRADVHFDTETGKFFAQRVPTEAEGEAAAKSGFKFEVSDWVRDRM